MSYVATFVLLAVGLVLLAALATRFALGLRRFNRTKRMVGASVREHVGLLRARTAGLRVAVRQRRNAESTG